MIRREAFNHRTDDGNSSAHGGLEEEVCIMLLRDPDQLGTLCLNQHLVGCTEADALLQSTLRKGIGRLQTTHGLSDHTDLRVIYDGVEVMNQNLLHRISGELPKVQNIF